MPTLTAQKIEDIAFHAFRAAGARDEDARVVAEHLRDANLAGHDSHGLLRVLQYTAQIKARLQPGLTGGVYMNFLEGEESQERVKDGYAPEAFQRLIELKAAYDPDHRLRSGFNIPSAR